MNKRPQDNSTAYGLDLIDIPAGHQLFAKGDSGDTAYLIESGRIAVSVQEGEHATVLAELGPGELLGEIAIIDSFPRTATATAVAATQLRSIHRDQVLERLHHADPTLQLVFQILTERLRAMLDKLHGGPGDLPQTTEPSEADLARRAAAVDKLRLEADLRTAAERDQLKVFYQPVCHLSNRQIAGFEALLRWEHPSRGMVSPGEFINLAEETPLIEALGKFVLQQALKDLPLMEQVAGRELFVGINVSPRQIGDPGELDAVLEAVLANGLKPSQIKLELTESHLGKGQRILDWIAVARQHGFLIAIDDFGTGYSSLSQLLKLKAHTLKIDQSFVREMLAHDQTVAMIKAIVAIAQAFSMNIIAEGIETEDQWDLLKSLGCDFGQGYLIGKPMRLEPAKELLRQD